VDEQETDGGGQTEKQNETAGNCTLGSKSPVTSSVECTKVEYCNTKKTIGARGLHDV
jgi:hypothetical protein